MKARTMMLAAAVAAVVAWGSPASAQSHDRAAAWWDWALPTVIGGESVRTSRGVVVVPRLRDGGGKGPKFCRNGTGHPVHGRRWCAEKGFGRYARWERAGWGDIILRRPRTREATLERGTLIDILGDIILGRFEDRRRHAARAEPVTGRWVRAGRAGGRALQIRSGRVPLAELTDLDGDGRVDVVLVNGDR